VELSTEAQRSFFEFKALLENAHERGRQLLELTGDKVAEHVMCATVPSPALRNAGHFQLITTRAAFQGKC
jgi:hypothetical protein